ncbi:MAG: FAD-dependent oxidoreductase [Colwellia sp.]|nr:FAD-dependent oxidoreductase [Colwellia sp.]
MDKSNYTKNLVNQARRKFLKQSLVMCSSASIAACGGGSTPTQLATSPLPPTTNSNDTPGILTETSAPLNIVIIGAGMSGLIAGYELLRAGHQVTILEARDRFGGRVHTLYDTFENGQFAEAGASRIPSNHNLTLSYIEHFELNIDPFYPRTNNYFNIQNNVSSIISAQEYINQPPWPGSVNRSDFYKIRGGMANLPLALANSLSDNIVYASPVESVQQSNENVVIYTRNNEQYLADRVLCTVPLPVLNKISFTPPLSDQKTLASNGGYDYTDSTRLYTQFSERFWLADNLNGWGDTNWPEEVWQPTWDSGESSGIIQSYLRDTTATEIDSFDMLQQIESVHTRWQHVFPQFEDIIIRNHVHSWQKEIWTGSAYASPTNTQNVALASHIGLAEGRVHFAGEHASQFHGWIQGAIASGIRAANEIHNLTNR